jgi:hypothetical protein
LQDDGVARPPFIPQLKSQAFWRSFCKKPNLNLNPCSFIPKRMQPVDYVPQLCVVLFTQPTMPRFKTMNALASLGNDPKYGQAAKAFNASDNKAYLYSVNTANTATDLATLQQADEEQPVICQTFTLTPDTDKFNGTAGADYASKLKGVLK